MNLLWCHLEGWRSISRLFWCAEGTVFWSIANFQLYLHSPRAQFSRVQYETSGSFSVIPHSNLAHTKNRFGHRKENGTTQNLKSTCLCPNKAALVPQLHEAKSHQILLFESQFLVSRLMQASFSEAPLVHMWFLYPTIILAFWLATSTSLA